MSCPTELTLSIHADGELAANEARHIVAHVRSCARCRALLDALEQENAVLMEALREEDLVHAPSAPAASSSAAAGFGASSSAGWLGGAIAIAALAPLMLEWAWQAVPGLPAGLGWVGDFGGLGGVFSLSRGLMALALGGQDMWVSSIGFVATLFFGVGALALLALRHRPGMAAAAALAWAVLAGTGLLPSEAQAAEFRYEEEGTVKVDEGESIDDTMFLAGKTVIVAGDVDGDVFAAGTRVDISGTVRGNLYSAGESVTITGAVEGNVHAAGKTVELDTEVDGSGFLAGQTVILTEASKIARGGYLAGESVRAKGEVGRGVYFAAENMELSGTVERSVRGYARQVAVSSTGLVGGDFHVTVPAADAVEIDEGATVRGGTMVDIDEEIDHEQRAFLYPGFYVGVLAKALALLLIGLLLVTLFPSLRPPSPESSGDVLRDMGIGFIALLATPVAIVLVALTLIGIPIAIVLAAAYGLMLFLSTLVVADFAGRRLPIGDESRELLRTALALLGILFVVEIPFIGGGLHFLVLIFGLGCLLVHLRNLYIDWRGSRGTPAGGPGAPAGEPAV